MVVFSLLSNVPFGGRHAAFTLDQYASYWTSSTYRYLTERSLILGAHVTLGCILLGFPLAYVLARNVPGRWREALFMLVILPFWSNSVVRTYSWVIVLQDRGPLGRLVDMVVPGRHLGLLFTYPAIVVGMVHSYLPYVVLTLYVSLQAIESQIFEAATTLGAEGWQIFWRITLPLSVPGLIAGSILTFIPVTGSFFEPRLLGGMAGTVIGTVIEDQFVTIFNWPFGAAIAFSLLLVLLVLMGLLAYLRSRLARA
jgi:spermidine/putrescine transport system permease protein